MILRCLFECCAEEGLLPGGGRAVAWRLEALQGAKGALRSETRRSVLSSETNLTRSLRAEQTDISDDETTSHLSCAAERHRPG